jgi:UDP-N-acetylglucosamine 2-epimerase (non-hydrolysing)
MKIVTIFGTRPEAIKLAPVLQQLNVYSSMFDSVVCVTAQHRQMLDQVLSIFRIVPDYDLNIMTAGQDLFDVTTRALAGIGEVLIKEKPELVLVQGDTTTAFAAGLAAYYLQIPIGHIEAGLRTYDKYNPFPEEKNRHLVDVLADYHFASTDRAKSNLVKENIDPSHIWVTGNTVIDALLSIAKLQENPAEAIKWTDYFLTNWGLNLADQTRPILLVTGHRRESFGQGFKNICLALSQIARQFPKTAIVYPVHLNPNVQQPVTDILGSIRSSDSAAGPTGQNTNIYLIQPLDYQPFVFLMRKAYLILTDSGGIQEEAPSLGKPVVVMRETTERPEGIEAGSSKLAGTSTESIVNAVAELTKNPAAYAAMAKVNNPYGDGKAAERVVKIISEAFALN